MTRQQINKLTKTELKKAKNHENPMIRNMARIEWDCRYKNNAIGRLVLGGCTGEYQD